MRLLTGSIGWELYMPAAAYLAGTGDVLYIYIILGAATWTPGISYIDNPTPVAPYIASVLPTENKVVLYIHINVKGQILFWDARFCFEGNRYIHKWRWPFNVRWPTCGAPVWTLLDLSADDICDLLYSQPLFYVWKLLPVMRSLAFIIYTRSEEAKRGARWETHCSPLFITGFLLSPSYIQACDR